MRVTVDTNTIVSGSLWYGPPRGVLKAAQDELIELFTTRELLAELEDVLGREKFSARLAAAELTVRDLVRNYAFVANVVKAKAIEPIIIRDPDDDAVLACAAASQSDVIVSGDKDLLDLGIYNGIRILKAAELLVEIGL